MKKSSDQTFMLTTSTAANKRTQKTTACHPQSALTPVRSVECGLCASTPSFGSLQRISFFSVQ